MQAIKRSRRTVELERDDNVETISSRNEPRKRPRISSSRVVTDSPAASDSAQHDFYAEPDSQEASHSEASPDSQVASINERPSVSSEDSADTASDGSESERSDSDDRGSSPERTQYEIARDGDFEHLQYAEEDLQRATQKILSRPTQAIGDNHPAEGGVIDRVECINFMCHERLVVELGPLINFIVGENGSGKSAVLTALTLCLGGKASSTNRGGSLKSFIKEGRDHCSISVKLTNKGPDAFQPDVYGDFITVERHFSRLGSSGFKLKNALGRIVSAKKSHVDELSEWYCLQMDNPLNVLSQDNARQFLNTATPTQKYKFFVQGVQLEQLDNDYRIVREFTEHLENKLESAAELVASSEEKWRAAQKLRETVDKNEEMRQKLRLYVNQLAWAQVADQERLLAQREEAIVKMDERIVEAERAIQDKSQILDAADEQLQRANDAVDANRAERDQYVKRVTEATETFQIVSKDLQHIHAEERDLYGRLKYASDEVDSCKSKISEEETRLDQSSGAARLEKETELKTLKAAEQDLELQVSRAHERQPGLRIAETDEQKRLVDFQKGPLQKIKVEIDQTNLRIQQLKQNASSKYAGFEPKMAQLVARIDNNHSFRQKPIGPLGAHIHLLKPQWAGIIEAQLGQSLSGFIVTNLEDQRTLQGVMSSVGVNTPIFISTGRRLDPRGKEPDEQFETILRVLQFDAEVIRDQLIINGFIEQIVLEEDRRQASDIILSGLHNVKFCLSYLDHRKDIGLRTMRNASGEVSTSPVNPRKGRIRMRTDEKVHLGLEEEKLDRLTQDYQALQEELRQRQNELEKNRADVRNLAQEISKLKASLRHTQSTITDVQAQLDAFEGADGRLHVLRDELAKREEEKETYGVQYGNMHLQKRDLNAKAEKCKKALDDAKADVSDQETRQRKLEGKAQRYTSSRSIALSEKNQAHENADIARNEKQRALDKRDAQNSVVENFVREAQKCAPQRVFIGEDETFQSVEQKYKALKNQLKQREKVQGASDADIYARAEETKTEHETLLQMKSVMESDLDGLKRSLDNRHDRWRSFQRQISARTRAQFAFLLSERAFRGDIILDHRSKKLALEVEPDETQENAFGRNTKTLSGGEKSFSSICLLLSVWEAMGSPIRCLDEFDVFMDNVNRAISTNLLIEAARRSVSRQYILITPNAIEGRAKLAKDVKIIRLTDPRQRTLPEMVRPSH